MSHSSYQVIKLSIGRKLLSIKHQRLYYKTEIIHQGSNFKFFSGGLFFKSADILFLRESFHLQNIRIIRYSILAIYTQRILWDNIIYSYNVHHGRQQRGTQKQKKCQFLHWLKKIVLSSFFFFLLLLFSELINHFY